MSDECIILSELNSWDIETVRGWRNHPNISKWCRHNEYISDVQQKKWYEAQSTNASVKTYKISVRKESLASVDVGVCGFSSIDTKNRTAEFNIYIAQKSQWNGSGRAALKALLDRGFLNFGFNSIWGEVFETNIRALKVFDQIGFSNDGIRRQAYFRDGSFIDSYILCITASEWAAKKLQTDG